MRIYVASSWRNTYQPSVVLQLRAADHEVYDFRNPAPGDRGFAWSQIDKHWLKWEPKAFIEALKDPIAEAGFANDWNAMQWADACVLVLPSGRSAHLEAGYFVGAKKPIYIYVPELPEPELMYKMTDGIFTDLEEILWRLPT